MEYGEASELIEATGAMWWTCITCVLLALSHLAMGVALILALDNAAFIVALPISAAATLTITGHAVAQRNRVRKLMEN